MTHGHLTVGVYGEGGPDGLRHTAQPAGFPWNRRRPCCCAVWTVAVVAEGSLALRSLNTWVSADGKFAPAEWRRTADPAPSGPYGASFGSGTGTGLAGVMA